MKQIDPILNNGHYSEGSGVYLVDIDYCRKLSSWGDWSTCSTSCGDGEMTRSRSCLRGCESSTDDLTQTQACNLQQCPPGKNLLPLSASQTGLKKDTPILRIKAGLNLHEDVHKIDLIDFGTFSGPKNALLAHLLRFSGLLVMLIAFASKFLIAIRRLKTRSSVRMIVIGYKLCYDI